MHHPQEEKEADVQRATLDYLTLKGIFHYRNNSGAFVDAQKHFYRFGVLGSPDIVCVVKGQYVGIEVKGSKGKQSDNQKISLMFKIVFFVRCSPSPPASASGPLSSPRSPASLLRPLRGPHCRGSRGFKREDRLILLALLPQRVRPNTSGIGERAR
jgi:hypothetical protein